VNLEWGKVVKTLNWTFIANLVNFAILLYLMKRFLYKPALAYLDRRREQIASRMEAARQSEERAEQLARQREQELSVAREQSHRTLEDARARAEETVNEAKGTARQEGERIIAEAQRQIEQEREQMKEDLRRSYAEIAVLGASRVLNREVNLSDHERLLNELLSEVDDEALRMQQ
jgi:F-type H+-transporting ATPase subunit b